MLLRLVSAGSGLSSSGASSSQMDPMIGIPRQFRINGCSMHNAAGGWLLGWLKMRRTGQRAVHCSVRIRKGLTFHLTIRGIAGQHLYRNWSDTTVQSGIFTIGSCITSQIFAHRIRSYSNLLDRSAITTRSSSFFNDTATTEIYTWLFIWRD